MRNPNLVGRPQMPAMVPPRRSRAARPGQKVSQPNFLRPWLVAGEIQLTLGCIALLVNALTTVETWWISTAVILASGMLLLPTAIRSFKRRYEMVISDHLLVLSGAYVVYFVLGALLIPVGPRGRGYVFALVLLGLNQVPGCESPR